MDYLPTDPAILVSTINMLLRDEEFDSLEQICYAYNRDPEQLKAYLLSHGYVYSVEQRQMRPEGYDRRAPVSRPPIASCTRRSVSMPIRQWTGSATTSSMPFPRLPTT